MSYIFKNAFKKSLLYSLYNEIRTNANSYYYFLAKTSDWEDENVIPLVTDTIIDEVNTRNNIIFTKKITVNDLAFIIPRYDWDYGIVFDNYNDNVEHLEDYKFYCVTANNRVYKCIDNNNNSPSLIQPYATSQNVIRTSDGYKWKYMYTIPIALSDRFLTSTYIPVINDIISEYYLRGSIYSATLANYGIGYSRDTKLDVIGDGHQLNNKYKIVNCDVISTGSGYLFNPIITFSPPFDAVPFQTNTEYLYGQYLSIDGRYYEVVKGGISSDLIPIHTCVCTDPIDNGTLSLMFVGRNVLINIIDIVNYGINELDLSGFIGEVIITNSGYGYNDDNPPIIYFTYDGFNNGEMAQGVCISKHGRISSVKITESGSGYVSDQSYGVIIGEPFTPAQYINFEENLTVDITQKDIIKSNNLYYKALNSGQLSTIAPTHDVGVIMYGDVELEFVGELAAGVPSVYYGYGYSTPPTITIPNPHLYDFNYISYLAGITVNPNDLVKLGDFFYKVINTVVLPVAPSLLNGPPYITGLSYVKSIFMYEDNISLETGDLVYTDTNPKRFYEVQNNIASLSVIPEHITGTVNDLTYIPLELPSIKINTVKTKARFTPIIENTQIVGVVCNDPGIGYTNANIITEESYYGVGTGAQIIPNIIQGSSTTKQEYIELSAISGTIDRITVVDGGTGYSSAPQVIIQGDGSNCTAIANLINGSISTIEITSSGQNYSTATISFVRDEQDDTENSINAVAIPVISPQSGHANNSINELYSNKLAICSSISAEKINGFTTNNEYRQFGIIKNPTNFLNKSRYNKPIGSCCYTLYCMIQTPINTDSFLTDINNNVYNILGYNLTSNSNTYINLLLHAVNNSKLSVGQTLYQEGKTIIIVSIDYPDIDKQSGELLLIDNRTPFIPNKEQTVVLKTIINL